MTRTRDTSLRAEARARFRAAADALTPIAARAGPATPGGGPHAEAHPTGNGDAAQSDGATDLAAQVRALYEAGVVPVRDIARIAGIGERMLYKYAARGGWRRRYARRPLTRGTGGRFVAAGGTVAPRHGLKALDPAGAARAGALVRAVDAAATRALAQARAARAARAEAGASAAEMRRLARLCRTLVAARALVAQAQRAACAEGVALGLRIGHIVLGEVERLLRGDRQP